MIKIGKKAGGITIECRVTPRASRNTIKGWREGVLMVNLTAPPVEGRANKALIEIISKELGVRKSAISIIAGKTSRNKVVFIEGLTAEQVGKTLSDKVLKT